MSILFYLGIGVAVTVAFCLFLKICDMTGIDSLLVMVFVIASILFAILAYVIHDSYEMHKHTQIESEVR